MYKIESGVLIYMNKALLEVHGDVIIKYYIYTIKEWSMIISIIIHTFNAWATKGIIRFDKYIFIVGYFYLYYIKNGIIRYFFAFCSSHLILFFFSV